MDKNPVLALPRHFMTLTVALPCINFYTKGPDLTCFSNHTKPEEVEEFYVWNLSQCDVSISGLQPGRVKIDQTNQTFASLSDLVPAQQTALLASDVTNETAHSAADCVLTVQSGTLTPVSPLGVRTVDYFPFDPNLPQVATVKNPRNQIADGAELALVAVGSQITLNIRRRTDNERWSITLEEDNIVNDPPIITLGNTCGCAVNSTLIKRDTEFAGYYELLSNPQPSSDRLIPVVVNANISTSTCDVPALMRSRP
jgi:hypothetical protein